jgi:biopolymer transport protein ExbB/TolQ
MRNASRKSPANLQQALNGSSTNSSGLTEKSASPEQAQNSLRNAGSEDPDEAWGPTQRLHAALENAMTQFESIESARLALTKAVHALFVAQAASYDGNSLLLESVDPDGVLPELAGGIAARDTALDQLLQNCLDLIERVPEERQQHMRAVVAARLVTKMHARASDAAANLSSCKALYSLTARVSPFVAGPFDEVSKVSEHLEKAEHWADKLDIALVGGGPWELAQASEEATND